jgi:Glycosyltransferase family 87
VQQRPETVFAVSALALLTWPVAYTLHLGEVNLIVAAMAGADLLRRRDGRWWQGIATGLAVGTPRRQVLSSDGSGRHGDEVARPPGFEERLRTLHGRGE